jgi:hypothetical protein
MTFATQSADVNELSHLAAESADRSLDDIVGLEKLAARVGVTVPSSSPCVVSRTGLRFQSTSLLLVKWLLWPSFVPLCCLYLMYTDTRLRRT